MLEQAPLSILDLFAMKQRATKIACLTAYDASFSYILDQAGVDIILVGDSLGMVIQGRSSTLPVTVADMVYHCQCVDSGRRRAFLIADLPFMSYATVEQAVHNAACLMREGGAQMVKLEGGGPLQLEVVRYLTAQGIPVCAHLGLLPQSVHQLGGYCMQGKTTQAAQAIEEDAQALQAAGAKLLVLECVPTDLAQRISAQLQVPTIGIGAGQDCDGQILVLYDMLGLSMGKRPLFSHNFLQDAADVPSAVTAYVAAVRNGEFPYVAN